MKKRVLVILLAVVMLAGLLVVPAGAAAAWSLPPYVILNPGGFAEIRAGGLAKNWVWSCSDETVVAWDSYRWTCSLRGLKPGTATITVKYTIDDGSSAPREVTETCAVAVRDSGTASTHAKLEPLISFGTVGEDVSGIIDGAKGFNYGFLPVRYKGLWGLADANMKLVVPFQYEDNTIAEQQTRSNSECAVDDMGHMSVRVDGRDYIIDWRGNVIYAASGSGKIIHADARYGYFQVRRYHDLSHLDKVEKEYYDYSGKEITQTQAETLQREAEAQLAQMDEARGDLYRRSGGYGPPTADEVTFSLDISYYDQKVDMKFQSSYAREGLLVVRLKDGKYGAIDTTGLRGDIDTDTLLAHTVIPFEYDYLHPSREGYVSYQKGSEFGLLENPVNPPAAEAAKPSTPTPTPDPTPAPTPADSDFTIEDSVLIKYNGPGGAVVIPDGVTSIGGLGAFRNCKTVTSVTIPGSVTSIGHNAFDSCISLTNVTIPDSVTDIGTFAFCNCISLTNVTIPDGVTSIGSSAFYKCTGLAGATIPNSVTKIKELTFVGCSSLASVTIPASVTDIDGWAFDGCTALKDVYYGGTEAQWKAIQIGNSNDPLESAIIHYNGTGSDQTQQPTTPEQPAHPQTAKPTNDKLTVDGAPVAPAAYKINNANYFKLRDVAMLLSGSLKQFNVGYDSATRSVTITTGEAYKPIGGELGSVPTANATATTSNNAIIINGEKVDLTVYKINNENYFQVRDLGKKLDFNVGWTAERGMFIEGDKSYDPSN